MIEQTSFPPILSLQKDIQRRRTKNISVGSSRQTLSIKESWTYDHPLLLVVTVITQYLSVIFVNPHFHGIGRGVQFHKCPIAFNGASTYENREFMIIIRLMVGEPMGMS